MHKRSDIAFGQRIELTWLRAALEMHVSGRAEAEIEETVRKLVQPDAPERDTARKRWVNVARIWVRPPEWCQSLHERAKELYQKDPNDKTFFILNWGMAAAAYPSVGYTAQIIGRLIRLKGEAKAEEIKRRMTERYGDRDFVLRATRYTVSSFLEWGAINGAKRGLYSNAKPVTVDSEDLHLFLVEALLRSTDQSNYGVSSLADQPFFFPFQLPELPLGQLRSHPKIEMSSHGIDDPVVSVI